MAHHVSVNVTPNVHRVTNLTNRCYDRYSPQLYVAGEFIGGSDIMIEMYQNGELGEMIEKAKAEMM